VVIMVAQRDAQNFLGFVLFDNETIEVFLDIARFVFELEFARLVLYRLGFHAGWILGRRGVSPSGFWRILKMLPHKIG